MIDVSAAYGPHGLSGSGDLHVAEILRRTTDGLPEAMRAFDMRNASLMASGSLVGDSLPMMNLVHAEWLASLFWQLATCYLDEAVATREAASVSFATTLYPVGDALCDTAAQWMRDAAQTRSSIANEGRVHPAQPAELPVLTINQYTFRAIWTVYDWLTYQVAIYSAQFEQKGLVPVKLRPLYTELLKQLRPHIGVMSQLRKDFQATLITDNALDILREATSHVKVIFDIGQQLWAPSLIGPRYAEAMRRQLTLEELDLGFDPWIMTDPSMRKQLGTGATSRGELVEFWSSIKDLASVHTLVEQVIDLRRSDAIRRRYGRGYPTAPWPSQFMVRTPITLCGRNFVPGDLIAFFVRFNSPQGTLVDVRKTGHLTKLRDLLGHSSAE